MTSINTEETNKSTKESFCLFVKQFRAQSVLATSLGLPLGLKAPFLTSHGEFCFLLLATAVLRHGDQ